MVNYYQQKRDLVEIKALREEYRDVHSQVLQDILPSALSRAVAEGEGVAHLAMLDSMWGTRQAICAPAPSVATRVPTTRALRCANLGGW